jgi:hypothetical protein
MTRMPNNEFFPDYSDEEHNMSNEHVSLNKNTENTPFFISSQIAEKTKDFAHKTVIPEEIAKYYNNDWMLQYQQDDCLFVPENRWTHEVVIPPIEVDKDLYVIKLSADIYFRRNQMPIDDEKMSESFNFVSRTLYPYVEGFKGDISFEHEDYHKKPFCWILRWLPKNDCTLVFYTDPKIEETMLIKTPEYSVELKENDEKVYVPFFLHKNLSSKMSAFKHDSDILYMRRINHEKE